MKTTPRSADTGKVTHQRSLEGPWAYSAWRPWFQLMLPTRLANPMRVYNNPDLTTAYRGELYLHAGSAWDREGARAADARGLLLKERQVKAGYVGLAVLTDVHPAGHPTCQCDRAWAQPDAYHWCFTDVRAFTLAYPGSGRSGLFRPDPTVVELRDELLSREPEVRPLE